MNAPMRTPRVSTVTDRLQRFIDSDNVAELLEEDEVGKIGKAVCRDFEIDERSNTEWRGSAKKSLEVALQTPEVKSYPFPGAANVKYPLITVAALQFNARSYPAIVDGDMVVKAKVVGSDGGVPKTDEQGQPVPVMGPDGQPAPGPDGQPQIDWELPPGGKRKKADRISRHMSYQLLEEMPEWEEDTDTLLMQLPIVGTAFRKAFYDPALKRNKSEMISGLDLVVHKDTKSLETCPRITHIIDPKYPHEIEERKRSGLWLEDFDPGPAESAEGDDDAPHEFLEQHRLIDLDQDGYREPYIVTVHRKTQAVVRIVANYGRDDVVMAATKIERIERRDYFVKYGFIPDPKGGFYDIGFGRLLESLGAAIDTSINQLIDAAHLQVAGGGFVGSGVRFNKGSLTLTPGTWKTVNAAGRALKEAMVPYPAPDPSPVLFSLLGMMIDAAKDITAVQDILTGDSKDQNQTATTTLALIEQGMKVFTAIYKRIYRSMKREFKLLYRLNSENLPDEAYFTVLDEPEAIARKDYQEGTYDVCPQADPRLVTDMQKMARSQALLQTYQMNPNPEILRRYYESVGAEDIDAIMPQPNEMAMKQVEEDMKDREATRQNEARDREIAQFEAETDRMEAGVKVADSQKPPEQRDPEMERWEMSLRDREIGVKETDLAVKAFDSNQAAREAGNRDQVNVPEKIKVKMPKPAPPEPTPTELQILDGQKKLGEQLKQTETAIVAAVRDLTQVFVAKVDITRDGSGRVSGFERKISDPRLAAMAKGLNGQTGRMN